MKASPYSVVLVYSTSHAIRLESLFEKQDIPCRLIPVPRHLSSDCGVCVRVPGDTLEQVEQIIAAAGLEIQEIAALD